MTRRPTTVGRPEALLAAAGYAALTVLVYARLVADAGLLHDDWYFVSMFSTFTEGSPIAVGWSAIDTNGGDRPVGFFLLGLVYDVFGDAQWAYMVMLGGLSFAVSLLLYAATRLCGLPRAGALAVGGLSMLIPVSDAVRLWPAAASANLALALVLLGLVAALLGLRQSRRIGLAWHAGALVLYAASALTYEATITLIPLLFLAYRCVASWSAVARRAVADWALTGALLAWLATQTVKDTSEAASVVDRVWEITVHAVQIYSSLGTSVGAAVGVARVSRLVVVAAVVLTGLVVGLALLRRRRLDARSANRRRLESWLLCAGAGALTIVAGHATLLAVTGYVPLGSGISNRVNVVAGVGYVLLTFAVGMLALELAGRDRLTPRVLTAATAALAVVLGVTYAVRLESHQDGYVRAHALQTEVLAALEEIRPSEPVPATVVAFGVPPTAAPEVPVFNATWDLTGALRHLWRDEDVRAAPEGSLTGIRCTSTALRPEGALYDDGWETPYADVLLVDVTRGEAARPASQAECRQWVNRWLDGLG